MFLPFIAQGPQKLPWVTCDLISCLHFPGELGEGWKDISQLVSGSSVCRDGIVLSFPQRSLSHLTPLEGLAVQGRVGLLPGRQCVTRQGTRAHAARTTLPARG